MYYLHSSNVFDLVKIKNYLKKKMESLKLIIVTFLLLLSKYIIFKLYTKHNIKM